MTRHFGLSNRTAPSGLSVPSGPRGANATRANSFPPLPSGSIAGCSPLERGNALQTVLDCLAVLAAFLLVSATGIGIAAAFWILLFFKL